MSKEAMTTTQERAARLTEEERKQFIETFLPSVMGKSATRLDHALFGSVLREFWREIDRLTAAPASQVTREEIAWIVFEAKAGPYLTHWPAVYSSSWTFKAADAIMSLLASRGLVKE